MASKKKEIINEVGEELDVNISRVNPLKNEWRKILSEIRRLKND